MSTARHTSVAFAAAVVLVVAAPSAAARAVEVRFEVRQTTRWGESVYVTGDRPELGGGDRARALRMVFEGGDVWRLAVDIPAGARYRYAFVVRDNAPARLADALNARSASGTFDATAPGAGGGPRAVRVRYWTGFSQPFVRWARQDGDWRDAALRRIGPGRNAGEGVWEATVETLRPELELVCHDGSGRWDNPPGGGNYRTTAAVATVRDGRIVSGENPSAQGRGRVQVVRRWYSNILRNARDVFIYFPPSYDRDPSRRFPVLYAHDGQNLFGPDAMFGGWRVEEAADRAIAEGRMEEVIVVGLGNTSARMDEYIPDDDGGNASRYGDFIIREIKPWVDASWRTKTGPKDTGIMGSSLGGIVSLYLGWERPDVFGKVASLSGSYWLEEFGKRMDREPARDLRVWLDSGNTGASNDGVEGTIGIRDILLRKGWVLGDDLQHMVDYGAAHNEQFWRRRVDRAMAFLFPAK